MPKRGPIQREEKRKQNPSSDYESLQKYQNKIKNGVLG